MDPAIASSSLPETRKMEERKYDIIIIGATGVTGTLVAKHLSANAPNITWAICGRSQEKLDKLIRELPETPEVNRPDILIIDVLNDPESKLRALLEDTRVVIDVVGPYSYWGEKVLKPCVEAGTAWVDLNGETPWVQEMIEKYQGLAKKTKAIIVNACGYDCIPSDIGVYLLSRFVGQGLGKVDAVVEEAVGLASFGTLSSILAPYYTYPKDKILGPNGYIEDPYFLFPQEGKNTDKLPVQSTNVTVRQAHPNLVYHAPLKHTSGGKGTKRWGGYLISSTGFEAVNRPVVMRSYGLRSSLDEQGQRALDSYGPTFKYREWLLLPGGRIKGLFVIPVVYVTVRFFAQILSFGPVRGFLKFLFQKLFGPGYGPSPAVQERGGFRWRFIGEAVNHEPSSERAVLQMEGRRDVGYGWTSVTLAETALHLVDKLRNGDGIVQPPKHELGGGTTEVVKKLAEEWGSKDYDDVIFGNKNGQQRKGGFWTTACFGMALVHRLLRTGIWDVELNWVNVEEKKKQV